jgi:limonene 1,2-monooxygenase
MPGQFFQEDKDTDQAEPKKHYSANPGRFIPHFQDQHHTTMQAAIRAQKLRPDLVVVHAKTVETAQAIYDSEKAARTAGG